MIVLESRWPGLRQTQVPVEEEATRDSNTIEALGAESPEAHEKHKQLKTGRANTTGCTSVDTILQDTFVLVYQCILVISCGAECFLHHDIIAKPNT